MSNKRITRHLNGKILVVFDVIVLKMQDFLADDIWSTTKIAREPMCNRSVLDKDCATAKTLADVHLQYTSHHLGALRGFGPLALAFGVDFSGEWAVPNS